MNVARRLSARAAILIAAVLGTGGLVLSAGVTTAHASVRPASTNVSSVSPDFTCMPGYTCFFSGLNYNDTLLLELENSLYAGGVHQSFSSFGVSNPGSANMDGGSTLWVEDVANHSKACVYDGRIVLNHAYGWFWINYGVNTCTP